MKITAMVQSALGEKSILGKNILWLVISRFGTQGLMVLFTLVLARRLGSAEFGVYALFAAVIFVGNALTTFGTDMLLIREIAGKNDLSQLLPALLIQLVLSAGFILLVWAAAPLLPNQSPAGVLGLKIYSLALVPLAFFSVFTAALRGKQRMDLYTALNLTVSALQLAAVWVLIRPGGSIVLLAEVLLWVQCAAALLGGVLCAVQISGFWKSWHTSWQEVVRLVRRSAPIAFIALISILYQKISIYMISAYAGPAATGWFSAGLRMLEAAKTVHLAVFTALYPAMASVFAVSVVKAASGIELPWKGSFQQSWRLLLLGSVAVSVGLFLFAAPLIQALFGTEYLPANAGLKILAWILIPFTINTFSSLSILAYHEEQVVLRVQSAGLAALILLNAWWIPRWGINGACLGLVAAETAQSVLYLARWEPVRRKTRQWAGTMIGYLSGDRT